MATIHVFLFDAENRAGKRNKNGNDLGRLQAPKPPEGGDWERFQEIRGGTNASSKLSKFYNAMPKKRYKIQRINIIKGAVLKVQQFL
jgi:hypothetical protein